MLITNGHYDRSQPWQSLSGASRTCFPDCPSLAVYGVDGDENVNLYKLTLKSYGMLKFVDRSYHRPVFISIQDEGIKYLSKNQIHYMRFHLAQFWDVFTCSILASILTILGKYCGNTYKY